MKAPLALALLLLAAAAPLQAAPDAALLKRVKAFLKSKFVTEARRSTAVAAVRGSAPRDQEENLDQLLLDAVAAQRAAAAPDRAALKRLYEALGVSYAVQAHAAGGAQTKAAAARELSAWARAPRRPALPASLASALSRPAASFNEEALVKAGWGRYVREIRPAAPERAEGEAAFDAETSALDEQLSALRDSWLTRSLDKEAEAKALLLAAQVSAALGSAPFRREAAPAAASVSVSAALPESGEPYVEFVPRKVYDGASRSVVVIMGSEPSSGAGELGTGSVVDERGRVLTNAHVVIQGSTKKPWPQVRVYYKPSRMTGDPRADLAQGYAARVLAHDAALDLALLEVEGAPPAPALALADPPSVSVGDRVAAIGHPEQGGLWTLTTGVLSSLVADIGGVKGKHVFQTDASINRGNSGGPLLDARGRIVGVNTLMSRKAADGLAITAVNFAVRSDVAAAWLKQKAGAAPLVERPAASTAEVMLAAASKVVKAEPMGKKMKPVTITESRPFDREELIAREIREMEDLEAELREEVRKRR